MRTPMRILSAATCAILLGGIVYLGAIVHAQQAAEGSSDRTFVGGVDVRTGGGVDAAACARLASLTLPNTTVTSADAVPAGKFKAPEGANEGFADLPAFCRVALTIAPSRDSDIKAEAWLPLAGWNGKFQQVGNGGWGGSIQYGALADALRHGYAAASTDTGHA